MLVRDPRENKCEVCEEWTNTCQGCNRPFTSNQHDETPDSVSCCCGDMCSHYGDVVTYHRYDDAYCTECCPAHGTRPVPSEDLMSIAKVVTEGELK